ncbi:MAG: dTDP-4-dehydrorhamnose reductase [Betaproteobacteria bacterium]|jgi:dTDP-4-dehydrorhamnose reductase|nr:dTDP-4-dehydrorhamnose reductase [Betaproteobacteria bacterium]
MKIVLFGAQGQLGIQLSRALAPLGTLVRLGRSGVLGTSVSQGTLCGDLTQPAAIEATIRALKPDAVVNAAAYTAVDKAQSDRATAFAVNADACAAMARACADNGAWLVHYSTDYVFDGSGTRAWREDDATQPVNLYGESKLAGEAAIRALHARHLILRCSWVFDTVGQNFLQSILRAAMMRDALRVVADQHGAPTRAALIADVTAHLLRSVAVAQSTSPADTHAGVYHLAPAGETSWHGYAVHLVQQAMARGLPVRCTPEHIAAIASSDYPTPAPRPSNSRLDTARLRERFGLVLPPWQDGVDAVIAELAAGWQLARAIT